jgi:hypothetical protein
MLPGKPPRKRHPLAPAKQRRDERRNPDEDQQRRQRRDKNDVEYQERVDARKQCSAD